MSNETDKTTKRDPNEPFGPSALRYLEGISATDVEKYRYAIIHTLQGNYPAALIELDSMSDFAKKTEPWQTNYRIYKSRLTD